jgi:3',5'-cyclic AMP phosphodiesterase CpdA
MLDVKKETAAPGENAGPEPMGQSRMDGFSLAHLSDLHLSSLQDFRLSQLLNKRLLGYLSWWRKRRWVHRREILDALLADLHVTHPDHIAVTGDLTHIGLPQEYLEVREWLPSLGDPENVTIIPGNHEAYAGSGWSKLLALWAPYLESDDGRGETASTGFFPSLRIRGEVAIIGLCSARPSLPLLATGSLDREQLSGLETLLRKTGEQGLLRVILIHHPPVRGVVPWRKRLTDGGEFAGILARCGAELVLHGHAHAPRHSVLETPAGKIPVIGAASASASSPESDKNAKYNIYRFSRSSNSWELTITVRGYSKEAEGFAFEEETVMPLPASGYQILQATRQDFT